MDELEAILASNIIGIFGNEAERQRAANCPQPTLRVMPSGGRRPDFLVRDIATTCSYVGAYGGHEVVTTVLQEPRQVKAEVADKQFDPEHALAEACRLLRALGQIESLSVETRAWFAGYQLRDNHEIDKIVAKATS